MFRWIKSLFIKRREKKQQEIDDYKEALSKIGFITVDYMKASRKFRRYLKKNYPNYWDSIHRIMVEHLKEKFDD
jgi:hypothetical protein